MGTCVAEVSAVGISLSHFQCMGAAISFSIVKLVLLVAWGYAGVYLVQVVEFGSVVGERSKLIVKLAALVAGPLIIPAIIATQTLRQSSREGGSFLESLSERMKKLVSMLGRSSHMRQSQDDTGISLFDAGGRSIEEIYGHAKGGDIRILDLTERIVAEALETRASDILY